MDRDDEDMEVAAINGQLEDDDEDLQELVQFKRFEIPTRDEDLFVEQSDDTYYVTSEQMSDASIESGIQLFFQQASSMGDGGRGDYTAVYEYFDVLFFAFKTNSPLQDWERRLDALQGVLNCMGSIRGVLKQTAADIFRSNGSMHNKKQVVKVTTNLLMLVYLMWRACCQFEPELNKRKKDAIAGRKGARQHDHDEVMTGYINAREKIVQEFCMICSLNVIGDNVNNGASIRFLWKGAQPDSGMIRAFLETASKLLENPEHSKVAGRPWLRAIFRLVRLLYKQFDQLSTVVAETILDVTMKLDYMNSATTATNYPFVEAIESVREDNDRTHMLNDMVAALAKPKYVDDMNRTPRPFALFIQSLGEKSPDVALANLHTIHGLLNSEPHLIRSAVLSTYCDLLILKMDDITCKRSARMMKTREKMFDMLQNHLSDVYPNVRIRVLGYWAKLAKERKIPASRLDMGLISDIGRHLTEKAVNVRKAALNFLHQFLTYNPMSHSLNYDKNLEEIYYLIERKRFIVAKKPEPEKQAQDALSRIETHVKSVFMATIEKFKDGSLESTSNTIRGDVMNHIETIMSQAREIHDLEAQLATYVALALDNRMGDEFDSNESASSIYTRLVDKFQDHFITSYIQNKTMNNIGADVELDEEDINEQLRALDQSIMSKKSLLLLELEIERCLPLAVQGMTQGEIQEMKEGIKFVVKCKNFKIKGAEHAVRSLCSLIWRNNEDVRKEVLSAAKEMFISENTNKLLADTSTINNLLSVFDGMKDDERCCVEEVICSLAAEHPFSEEVIKRFWDMITNTRTDSKTRVLALQMMTIIARSNLTSTRLQLRNLQKIIKEEYKSNPAVAVQALTLIANLGTDLTDPKIIEPVFRLPSKDSLFSTIQNMFIYELLHSTREFEHFHKVMKATLRIAFELAFEQIRVVSNLCALAVWYVRRVTECVCFYDEKLLTNTDVSKNKLLSEKYSHWARTWNRSLERLLSFYGEIACSTHVFVETSFVGQLKKLGEIINKEEVKPREAFSRPLKDWEIRCARRRKTFEFYDADQTMNTGRSEEERVKDRADKVAKNIMLPGRLLNRIFPLIVYCLRSRGSTPEIRNAASVAFSKFLVLSDNLPDRAGPFFFNLLNNMPSPMTRNNLMIVAGDISCRYPNLLESHAHDMYSMALDDNPTVRETFLLVLTYLIKSDMVKIRGTLADVALGFCDKSAAVKNLTETIFKELHTQKNKLQEMLPEFISRLAYSEKRIPYNTFTIIAGKLLKILKDGEKAIDVALPEKICSRMKMCLDDMKIKENPRMGQYYSYCLSHLTLSERSFVKVRNLLTSYGPLLIDEKIYNDFLTMLSTLSKNLKNDTLKTDIEEFEISLERHHTGTNEILPKMEVNKKAKRAPRGQAATRVVKKRSRRVQESDSEMEMEDDDE